jgi:hypothetical protein
VALTFLPIIAVLIAAIAVFFVVLYVWSGARSAPPAPASTPLLDPGGSFVRTYRGRDQEDAAAAYVADARTLMGQGYEPVAQSWGDGQWDAFTFVIGLVLTLFLGIGLILLAYMAIVRPSGTLLVTYRPRGA